MNDYSAYCNPGTPLHLGGHRNTTNMDKNLLEWLKEHYLIRTMLDVGCGPGGMLDYAAKIGIEAMGVDGDPTINKRGIVLHDFCTGLLTSIRRTFDLIWCVEVVEHLDEKYLGNLFCAFHLGRRVLMTHALPGQGGWHHVNCRDETYWIAAMESSGFRYSTETLMARANATPGTYTASHGLLFERAL